MNEIDSDDSDESQADQAADTASDNSNNRALNVIRLVDACKELDTIHAIQFLLSNGYYGFFVEIPHSATAYKQYFRNVPARSPQLRIPIDYSIGSPRFIQLGFENLEELAAGKSTNAFEFKGCLSAKSRDSTEDPQQFIFQDHAITLLRPRERQHLERTPVFTNASGNMAFARSEDPVSGKRSFLIANISAADLFIDAAVLSVAKPLMPVAVEGRLLAESNDSENQSQELKPAEGDWPFDVEVDDPHNFKELCPIVFEAMQIAQSRANDPMDDEQVAYFLRTRHPKKYKSPLGDKNRVQFLTEMTRPDYKPNPQLEWKQKAFACVDASEYIARDCYSKMLRLLMTVAGQWVNSGLTDEGFKQALKDRHFEDGEQGALPGKFSWIITGRYIPIDIQGRAD